MFCHLQILGGSLIEFWIFFTSSGQTRPGKIYFVFHFYSFPSLFLWSYDRLFAALMMANGDTFTTSLKRFFFFDILSRVSILPVASSQQKGFVALVINLSPSRTLTCHLAIPSSKSSRLCSTM